MLCVPVRCILLLCIIDFYPSYGWTRTRRSPYKKNPAPDGHRCGVCPTYFQKICGFDKLTNETYIFDNHCLMDLYNCIHGTDFSMVNWEACLFFGNFAYVHGTRYQDEDYDEDHVVVIGAKKNPDFA